MFDFKAYEDLMTRFGKIASNPKISALEWKEKHGGKVVGVSGLDVPEVILHAAGMLSVVLLEKDGPITLANAHVENHQCGYMRSVVDQACHGDYDYMDYLLFHDCCHIERMTGDALGMYTDGKCKAEFIYLPPALEYESTKEFTEKEFKTLIRRVEEWSGNKIDDAKLAESIKVFNTQRGLLAQLYDIRRRFPGIIKATDVLNVVSAGMVMPKEDHIEMLEKLLDMLKEKQNGFVASNKIPVFVHGSLCERCDSYILDIIESNGGVVVDDDLYAGARYFNTLYKEDLSPVDAIVDAYLHREIMCPTRYEFNRHYGDNLAELAEKSKAKVVVYVIVKYCEPHYYAYFSTFQNFRKRSIPLVMIETEHETAQPGQFKTGLEAVFEGLEA